MAVLMQLIIWDSLDSKANHFLDTFTYTGRDERCDPGKVATHIKHMEL